ncbi:DsbA family protein [Solitalea lacus]|uniref:DsbA family protein n=1 Tax=Solitalea lacus TaxID=2911172 RepID=UPI001EDB6E18|nr:thioredoxin domain-containing protein [Solitalea lacus]UKJ07499.1 thioredoxin domain-containing protein [Solitalea lacus]
MIQTGLGIVLGNPNAKNKIVKVCNPYCGPCATAHPLIDEIIDQYEDVQVQMIFMFTHEAIVKHLVAIYKKDNTLIRQALDDWYNAPIKVYETFAAKYPLNGELQQQKEGMEAMYKWTKDIEIAFTPTFFINGHQLPELYSISDIKNILAN